ncbi:MAG: four-carbon acid sugar kinase family protein [candidate division NC10 bacterium]
MKLSTKELGVLSDDLTGACDVAGYFVPAAGPVRICVKPASFDESDAGLSVVNLQSRRLSQEESCITSERAAGQLADRRVVFQKIDTAFRGPVGAGLKGLVRALGPRRILVAPAIPRIGRVTRGGLQYIAGVPIHETEFARDPSWPIHSADVRENIRRSGSIDCEICDAETLEDLMRVVDEALRAPQVLLVGSLGLAEALASRMERCVSVRSAPSRADWVLIVSGSQYQRSHVQLTAAAHERKVPIVDVHPTQPLAWPPDPTGALIVRLAPAQLPPGHAEAAVLERLTAVVASQIRQRPPEGLAIIGGETAFNLLGRIGVTQLWIHGVFADVVSYGTIQGGILDGRPCMLKGGSVGPDDVVIQMLNVFSSRGARSEAP